jgi:hypothetical protein
MRKDFDAHGGIVKGEGMPLLPFNLAKTGTFSEVPVFASQAAELWPPGIVRKESRFLLHEHPSRVGSGCGLALMFYRIACFSDFGIL